MQESNNAFPRTISAFFIISELVFYTFVCICLNGPGPQTHTHLYLLGIHDVDGQVERPEHHVAVSVAIVWRHL